VLGWRRWRVAKTTPKTRRKRRVLSVGVEGKGKGAVEDAEDALKGVFDMFGVKVGVRKELA